MFKTYSALCLCFAVKRVKTLYLFKCLHGQNNTMSPATASDGLNGPFIQNLVLDAISLYKRGSSWVKQQLWTFKNALPLVRGNADKFLVLPGKKYAPATKLGIYSTYSSRSSIRLLARCFNFCKPLEKKLRMLFVQPGLRCRNDLCVGTKMTIFQLFFQSREQVVVRRGQIRRIRWVIKKLEAQVSQFLLGCKCPVSRGIIVQEQDSLGDLPAAFFLQNVLHSHQQRSVILRVDNLGLLR